GLENRWFALGILSSMAYLLRGESLIYLLLLGLTFMGIALRKLRSGVSTNLAIRPIRASRLLLAGFLTLSLPYALFLRWQTGSWQISGKTMENLIAYDVSEAGSPVDYERTRMG